MALSFSFLYSQVECAVFPPHQGGGGGLGRGEGEEEEEEEEGEEGEEEREAEGVVSSSDTGRRRDRRKSVYKHVPHRFVLG